MTLNDCVDAGLRRSSGRQVIFDILARSRRPITIDEIHAAAENEGHSLTKSVIYRFVKDLEAAGFLLQWSSGHDKKLVCLKEAAPTLHFRTSSQTIAVQDPDLEEYLQAFAAAHGYCILHKDIVLHVAAAAPGDRVTEPEST